MTDVQNTKKVDQSLPVPEQVDEAINILQATGRKVNPNQIEKLISVSRSALYNHYPDEIVKIEKYKQVHKKEEQAKAEERTIEELLSKLDNLDAELRESKAALKKSEAYNGTLREDLQKLYRMYDDLYAERLELQDRLKHLSN